MAITAAIPRNQNPSDLVTLNFLSFFRQRRRLPISYLFSLTPGSQPNSLPLFSSLWVVTMTEYDYSPEAQLNHSRKMDSIERWAQKNSFEAFRDPEEPATPHGETLQLGLAHGYGQADLLRSRTAPPPGDVYGARMPSPPHMQLYPQHIQPHSHHIQPHSPPEPHPHHHRHKSHHRSKSKQSPSSFASASTVTLPHRPVPVRSQTYTPPVPMPMMQMPYAPQPMRAQTVPFPMGGGAYPNNMYQSQIPPGQTPFIPVLSPQKPEPLLKRVLASLFRGRESHRAASQYSSGSRSSQHNSFEEPRRSHTSMSHHHGSDETRRSKSHHRRSGDERRRKHHRRDSY
ncbi:hypothetical protein C8J56DRAFT_978714 [Mycena floridula]|nr:hypothetical protein C8J56DRAFT_978714 [Mycena floridula]